MTEAQDKFEEWAIVELFGHQRIAGLVSEASIGGCHFIRLDVPRDDGSGFLFTRYLGGGSIYAINVVDEPIAREAAKRFQSRPVYGYEMPALESGARQYEPDDDDDDLPI